MIDVTLQEYQAIAEEIREMDREARQAARKAQQRG